MYFDKKDYGEIDKSSGLDYSKENTIRRENMEESRKYFGLTGNQLKLRAIVLMTIDHIGAYLLPQYIILRYSIK